MGARLVILCERALGALHNTKVGAQPDGIKSLFWINTINADDPLIDVGAMQQ
jgi:hypothetical protein